MDVYETETTRSKLGWKHVCMFVPGAIKISFKEVKSAQPKIV